MSNYYDLLNVDARASTDDIKKAFRERAKDLHPDRNPTGDSRELRQQFAELTEAYEVRQSVTCPSVRALPHSMQSRYVWLLLSQRGEVEASIWNDQQLSHPYTHVAQLPQSHRC